MSILKAELQVQLNAKPKVKLPPGGPNSIKALAIDLDGTILAPGQILSERTVRAVKLCAERGIRVIIATGRAIEGAESFRSALGAEGPMVYYNGAVVVDMRHGGGSPEKKILNTILMDKKAAEFCVELARDMGVYCQIYVPGNDGSIPLLYERDTPEREMYMRHTGIVAEFVDLKEALARPDLQGCVKTMFLAEPEILAELRPKLEGHFRGNAYIAQSHRTFLEVMDSGASKGKGLEFIMKHCAIKKEEIIAFGDEENDIPMFEACGFSVATLNAKDNVKAAADVIVGSNAEDGVAAFLEEFFQL